jgi:hypothetical protein
MTSRDSRGGRPAGLLLLFALGTIAAAACGYPRSDAPQENDVEEPRRSIEEVQEAHTAEWMKLPGVVGTGIGLCDEEEPCIRVFLSAPSPEAEGAIPARVEGHRVELVVTGTFRPRVPPDSARP